MNFVCIVFELGEKMLTLSSMENLIVPCNHTTHTDRSICIIGIDPSHIDVPIPHIRIDLSALLG